MGDHTQNGGPAFPQAINPAEHGRGMTLRDYFAAQVLAAVYRDFWDDFRSGVTNAGERWSEEVAYMAYKAADAMIKERSKGGA